MRHPPLPVYLGTFDVATERTRTLRRLARDMGYITEQGSKGRKPQGNISQLMQAIADGKIIIVQRSENGDK